MKKGILFSSSLIIVALCCSFLAPGKDPDIEEVRSLYKKFNDVSALRNAGEKLFFLDYSVKTVTKDSVIDGIKNTEIRMWVDNKKMEVQSNEMQVYQDEKNAFVVLPSRKLIMRNDPDRRENKVKINQINRVQDTLFALSKVVSSGLIKNTTLKRIVLEVNENGKRLLKISKLTFVIDTRSHEFKSLKLDYSGSENREGNRIMYVYYDFKTISMDCKDKILNNNFSPLFMKSENNLIDKYQGYTLVDNRVCANKIHSK